MGGVPKAVRLVWDQDGGRECPKCVTWKLFSEFHEKTDRDHPTHCKVCVNSRQAGYNFSRQVEKWGLDEATRRRDLRIKKDAAKDRGNKVCSRCEDEKHLGEFHLLAKGDRGHAAMCKRCGAADSKLRTSRSVRSRLTVALNTARGSARRKGLPCTITLDDLLLLWADQGGRGEYTGVPMSVAGNREGNSVSIERVDSFSGYTPDNVVLCCVFVNRMKQDASLDEFYAWCEAILERRA